MASACVNNITMSPERFSPAAAGKYSSYGWLSPRISFSRDDDSASSSSKKQQPPPTTVAAAQDQVQDLPDFEFRLDDPVGMLPADELFSDGKLVPTQLTSLKPFPPETATETTTSSPASGRRMEVSGNSTSTITDQYLFSPKAPRCSSRWKELLGLRKFYHNTPSKPAGGEEGHKTTPLLSSSSSSSSQQQKSLMRHFLHRNSKSCSSCHSSLDSSLSLPLLKDLDCESVSISSSRLSLSSSSSSHEHEDLPRLSLDSEKQQPNNNPNLNFNPLQSPNPFVLNRNPTGNNNINPPRMRMVKHRGGEVNAADGGGASRVGRSPMKRSSIAASGGESSGVTSRGVSVDSPRLNSSGKLIFESLERSSSSPSSFNGGPRHKHKGMERSYSANVRVTPVLNVPVCSLRGSSKSGSVFGFFSSSSPQKRDGGGGIHRQQSSGSGSNSRGARSDRDGSSKQVTSSTTTPTIKF